MNNTAKKQDQTPFFLRGGVFTLISSVLCVAAGLAVGFAVLLIINPQGACGAMAAVLKNFFYYKKPAKQLYYLGSTLVKTVPLILCAESVLFARHTGLFNIGVAGQYCIGAGAAIFFALKLQMPWYVCLLAAMLAGALWAMITALLKVYCRVNEVISGIMLNWIALYLTNMLLTVVKDPVQMYTMYITDYAPQALLPCLGFDKLFGGNGFVGISLLIVPVVVVILWLLSQKTVLGYELRATGYNPNAAFYCGMNQNATLTLGMAIAGAVAGLGAALLYLTDIEQWMTASSAVPQMGFDGIAAAFLGGLNPFGILLSSFFIKHITIGGSYVDKTIFSPQTGDLISALIIYFCAFAAFLRAAVIRYYRKKQLAAQEKNR